MRERTGNVSIIIPIHNGIKDTIRCLSSLQSQSYSSKHRKIVVIDNASTDGSSIIIKKKFPNTHIISSSENQGFAKAINKGILNAKSDYFLIANNDIIFEKNYVSSLISYLDKHPDIGIIGGKIYHQRPKTGIIFSGTSFNLWTGSIRKLPNENQIQESDWIQGCAMMVKKEVFKRIGLFDENYFFSFEDADFCLRAKKTGFKVIYYPKAIAWHKEGATIDTFGQTRKSLELYKAKFLFILKHATLPQIISSTITQFLIIAPMRIFFVRAPYFSLQAMLKGYMYNLLKLKQILRNRQHESSNTYRNSQ